MSAKNLDSVRTMVARVLKEMEEESRLAGKAFSLDKVNLSEFQRRSGLSRQRVRTLARHGFTVRQNGNTGRRKVSVLSGYEPKVDELLRQEVTNSSVILGRLRETGYRGGRTTIKMYVSAHRDLVPAPRVLAKPRGNRGRRYETGPGECFQMDWGFVNVDDETGGAWKAACFVMVCHYCGLRYVQFFPNAKQENLFIGMLGGFVAMGLPEFVLTDNMKSVVTARDSDGRPIWNGNYAQFMDAVGFQTRLCRPRHAFTKGAVERLVRFVKQNFVAGRRFSDISGLNLEASRWCRVVNGLRHPEHGWVPLDEHYGPEGMEPFAVDQSLSRYRAPLRNISFDGYVSYEGRRYGVPLSYGKRQVRVLRDGERLFILDPETCEVVQPHMVDWSQTPHPCAGQWEVLQPEEFPTAPVTVTLSRSAPDADQRFARFGFDDGEAGNG